jgi:alkylresorcinol/alkylpyrone synthase
MRRTRASLSAVGNLSSSSVLHQLAELVGDGAPRAGTTAVVLAMGPGFATESVLLTW